MLNKLGCKFNDGKLEFNEMFTRNAKFDTNKEQSENDEIEKELLHKSIDEYVYQLLEEEGLRRLPVPKPIYGTIENSTFIYASKDSFENDKLMILVNGCGAKVGQWSRRIIINDNLNHGTQISYIKKAKELGYGILVLNINDNLRIIAGTSYIVMGSKDGYEHFNTVWNNYVQGCKAKHIAIIAHEFGGDCVIRHGMIFEEQFKDRVFAIALIDSMRVIHWQDSKLKNICQSWAYTNIDIQSVKPPKKKKVMCITSDNTDREKLPFLCTTSVFDYIQNQYLLVSKTPISNSS